jgi:hypothetical protein
VLKKGTKISCRIAPRPVPIPAAVIRLMKFGTEAELICCVGDCRHFESHKSPIQFVAHLAAMRAGIEHMITAHEWNWSNWVMKIDTIRPDGRNGWLGLDRAIAAERKASHRRLYVVKRGDAQEATVLSGPPQILG